MTRIRAVIVTLALTSTLAVAAPAYGQAAGPKLTTAKTSLTAAQHAFFLEWAYLAHMRDQANAGNPYAVEWYIRRAWAGTGQEERALRIAWRESNWQPWARNPSGARGLFQLMLPLHNDIFRRVGCDPASWADVGCNVAAARSLYDGAGWAPWAQTAG